VADGGGGTPVTLNLSMTPTWFVKFCKHRSHFLVNRVIRGHVVTTFVYT
jgi:hypothetical protein